MIGKQSYSVRIVIAFLLAYFLTACSIAPYQHESLESTEVVQRAVEQQQGHFTVKASVPSAEESEQIFGVPLYKRGIQPVWLEITNNSPYRARFAHAGLDRDYFPPLEVAYIHRKNFSKEGWQDMEKYLYQNAISRHIQAGETASGFIFTNASTGTKAFGVFLFYHAEIPEAEQFSFFVEVPGFTPDHAEIDFRNLYSTREHRDLNTDQLRDLLAELPCCTRNRDDSQQGQPINLVLVASGRHLLQAMLRGGWAETSYERNEKYQDAADYFFDRPADAVFRKGRDKTTERNELSVWLSPYSVDGTPVWFAQTKHAIGRRYKIGELFLGVLLDPDVRDGRNYVLQDLWYSQSLEAFAWSRTGTQVSRENPNTDFHGNPWFSDGYRLVLWLADDPVSLSATRNLGWDDVDIDELRKLE